jgi:hypothetical protein
MASSSGSTPSRRPSMKESLHVAGLPRHIPARCNSATTRASRQCAPRMRRSPRRRATRRGEVVFADPVGWLQLAVAVVSQPGRHRPRPWQRRACPPSVGPPRPGALRPQRWRAPPRTAACRRGGAAGRGGSRPGGRRAGHGPGRQPPITYRTRPGWRKCPGRSHCCWCCSALVQPPGAVSALLPSSLVSGYERGSRPALRRSSRRR